MSIEPGQLYLIRNKLASGLYLTLSQGDQKSIIGEDEGSGTAESQTVRSQAYTAASADTLTLLF
jgi:hypothetical protein